MKYDQLFRQAATINLELQWHNRETDTWFMAFMDAAGPPSARPTSQQGQPSVQHSTMHAAAGIRGPHVGHVLCKKFM